MKVYRTDEIRNVVLLGHGGSGKTSLAEAMAYVSGATNRMGKITDGNTISDFDKEEQKREFSISTSLVPMEEPYVPLFQHAASVHLPLLSDFCPQTAPYLLLQ